MSSADNIARFRFKPGQSGNPGGNPYGRKVLEKRFIQDLLTTWEEGGIKALRDCRDKTPALYIKAVASLMPKQIEPETLNDISRSEVRALITALRALDPLEESGVVGSTPDGGESSGGLPALPETV